MRIIAGTARGVLLRVPPDWQGRPTTDRVRGAVFSMLEAREMVRNRRVLDLFAGTGALGIEALSRGAASAVCVERSARLGAVIQENGERAGVSDRLTVLSMPVARAVPTLEGPFDLVFMDPPYSDADAVPTTTAMLLADDGLLTEGATLVVEHPHRSPAVFESGRLEEMVARRYGDTMVTLLSLRSVIDGESEEIPA